MPAHDVVGRLGPALQCSPLLASVVAAAGEYRRVTIATNMAGRGTDIKLVRRVVAAGGLHVLATERHEAARIDRQLYGRAGRQGDRGSYEAVLSLDDELMSSSHGRVSRGIARWLLKSGRPLQGRLARFFVRRAQMSAERMHARVRRELLQSEDQLESTLAFSGRVE